MGYANPTPIQLAVIPKMLTGQDVVGQAQTGTGKTASFGIPLAELVDGGQPEVQAIILVPTRELAVQVSAELSSICCYRGIGVVATYGGQPIAKQITALKTGGQIVVGTPGRVIDHLERGTLRFDKVRVVILDEADQMLDIGFAPDIRRILRMTPSRRQTSVFTATIPTPIRRLIYAYLKDPEWVLVGGESTPVEKVRQIYCEVAGRDKMAGLMELLDKVEGEQTMIFCRTQGAVDRIVTALGRRGYAIEGIHGGLPQVKRDAVMKDFREGKVKLLVATNLASRGLDIPAVSHIINYDIPENVEEYVHRIGRTARMGREGTAMTFVSEWDLDAFEAIKSHVGEENLERYDLALYQRR